MSIGDTPIYDQLLSEQGPLAVVVPTGSLEKFAASMRELGRQFSRALVIPIDYETDVDYFEPRTADDIHWKHKEPS